MQQIGDLDREKDKRIAELEAALTPFALLANSTRLLKADGTMWTYVEIPLSSADIMAARTALGCVSSALAVDHQQIGDNVSQEIRWAISDVLTSALPKCGECYYWMKSRDCPREHNVRGMNRGPSCGDGACVKFKAKDAATAAGIEARMHHKDFELVTDMADQLDLPMPATHLVHEQLNKLMQHDWGMLDTSNLLRVLEEER